MSESRDDVGFLKILPLEQERLASDLGERVGEAVAEIQPSRVTPFSKIVEGLARDVSLLDSERLDYAACPAEKHIALAGDFRPGLALNDYGEFQKGPGTDETAVGVVDEPGVEVDFGLPEQNRDKRGSVQDHFGRPCSS